MERERERERGREGGREGESKLKYPRLHDYVFRIEQTIDQLTETVALQATSVISACDSPSCKILSTKFGGTVKPFLVCNKFW